MGNDTPQVWRFLNVRCTRISFCSIFNWRTRWFIHREGTCRSRVANWNSWCLNLVFFSCRDSSHGDEFSMTLHRWRRGPCTRRGRVSPRIMLPSVTSTPLYIENQCMQILFYLVEENIYEIKFENIIWGLWFLNYFWVGGGPNMLFKYHPVRFFSYIYIYIYCEDSPIPNSCTLITNFYWLGFHQYHFS